MRIPLIPRACVRASVAMLRVRIAVTVLATAGAVVTSGIVSAEICKYQDPEGNVHYSNVAPDKGLKRLSCPVNDESPPTRPGTPPSSASARKSPSPDGFPKVDNQTQRVRDDMRKKVLNEELSSEQKLLAESRVAYADGAPPALPDEKADTDKYRARIARLRQAMSLHEKNIEALKKELSMVK